MGSGKSTVGKALANAYNLTFLDTDHVIETQQGRSISEIFEADGEASFRQMEAELCQELNAYSDHVISTGGGFMLYHDNARICQKLGPIIYLQTSLQVIQDRIQNETHRPLAISAEELQTRYQNRLPHYEALASATINTDNKAIDQLVQEIWAVYESY